jgi:hypothetical protein
MALLLLHLFPQPPPLPNAEPLSVCELGAGLGTTSVLLTKLAPIVRVLCTDGMQEIVGRAKLTRPRGAADIAFETLCFGSCPAEHEGRFRIIFCVELT